MNAVDAITAGLVGHVRQEPKESPADVLFKNSKEPAPEWKGREATIEEALLYNRNAERQRLV